MGNAYGKKMEEISEGTSKTLQINSAEGYCEKCDMILMSKDCTLKGEGSWAIVLCECPRCGHEGSAYTGKDHAKRNQPKGGDPWEKK